MISMDEPKLVPYIKLKHFFDRDINKIMGSLLQGIPYIFESSVIVAAVDALAEIAAGYTDELDGTGTPVIVDIISSDVNDDGAPVGTGAQTVKIMGIDTNGQYVIEEVTLNGTTAVPTVTLWQRIFSLWVTAVGSGKTTAGNITVHEDGGAVSTYMTITAGQMRTAAARIYIPLNWRAVIKKITISLKDHAAAAANIDEGAGIVVEPFYDDFDFTDYVASGIACYSRNPVKIEYPFGHREFGDTTKIAKLSLKQRVADADLNEDFYVGFMFVLWPESTAAYKTISEV